MKQLFSQHMVVSGKKFQVNVSIFGKDDYCIFLKNESELNSVTDPVWLWYENESWHFSEELNSDVTRLIVQKVEDFRLIK